MCSKGCVKHHQGRKEAKRREIFYEKRMIFLLKKWMHVRDEKMNNNNNRYVYARAFTPLRSSSSIYAPDLSMSFSANGFAAVWYPLVQSAPG